MSTNRIAPDGNDLLVWSLDESAAPFLNAGVAGTGGTPSMSPNAAGPVIPGQPGVFNNAVWIGGSGQYFLTSGDTALGETSSPGYPFTMSCWVKPYNFSATYAGVFIKEYHSPTSWTTPYYMGFRLDGQGNGGLNIYFPVGSAVAVNFSTDPNNNFTPGRLKAYFWNHIGLTYDGTNIRIYINGQLVTVQAETRNMDWGTHGAWRLGGDAYDNPFIGLIDDARVANVVRSPAWFASVYNGFAPTAVAPDASDQIVWALDETASPFANTGADGTVGNLTSTGSPSPFRPGYTSGSHGVQFPNNSASYLISANGVGEYAYPITVSFWTLLNSFTTYGMFLGKNYFLTGWATPYTPICFYQQNSNDGQWVVSWATGAGVGGGRGNLVPKISLGAWTHLGATYDGARMKGYINGRLAFNDPVTGSLSYGNHGPWWVGTCNAANYPIDGIVDDIRVANVVRDLSWFQSVYNGVYEPPFDATYRDAWVLPDNTSPLSAGVCVSPAARPPLDATSFNDWNSSSGTKTYFEHRGWKASEGVYYYWRWTAPDPTGSHAPTSGLTDIMIMKVYQG